MDKTSKRYFFVFLTILLLLVSVLGVDGLRTWNQIQELPSSVVQAASSSATSPTP